MTPTVELTANAATFTTPGTISLTATVKGGTPSAVTFFDGAQQLGQTATAPFTQSMDVAFPENGIHDYVAKAIVDGKEITSAAYPVNVDVPSNGLFVDPILGNDGNDGLSLQSPLKTILKAISGLLQGQYLYLAPGLYDAATQGMPLAFALPTDANVLTYPSTGLATLQGAGSGFTFPSGGSIKNVKFDGLSTASIALAGKFKASGLAFDNVGLPYSFPGSSDSTVDESTVPNFLANPPTTANGSYLLVANGTSKTALLGPTLNDIRVGVSAILAKGTSDVSIKNLKATSLKSRVMTIADNATGHLTDSSITGSGLPTSSGASASPIYMGLQDSAQPLTQTFEMINSTISGSPGSAIGLDLLPGVPSMDTISMIGSHLDRNGAAGLLATAPALASSTAGVVVNAAQSTFSNNAGDGLHLDRLTGGTITGSDFVSNAGNGIAAARARCRRPWRRSRARRSPTTRRTPSPSSAARSHRSTSGRRRRRATTCSGASRPATQRCTSRRSSR